MMYPHPNPLPKGEGTSSPFGRRAGDEGKGCLTHPIFLRLKT